MNELTIIEIREIEQTIRDVYDYDFSNYAMTSFKSRLERLIMKYNIINAGNLIHKLKEEKDFFDTFLFEISIPSTEMFRDPSVWRWLREEFFPSAINNLTGKFRIMIPCCVSGGELYSLAILLHEMDIMDRVQIYASSISNTAIELIKNGLYDLKKIGFSEENYKRYSGNRGELSRYYTIERYHALRDTSLIKDVEIKKVRTCLDEMPQNIKLILFRNNFIYFNPALQDKALRHLHNTLSVNGYLILGIQEKINSSGTFNGFETLNETERVYRKKQLN